MKTWFRRERFIKKIIPKFKYDNHKQKEIEETSEINSEEEEINMDHPIEVLESKEQIDELENED